MHFDKANNILYVSAVGKRVAEIPEKRDSVWFAYTDDFGNSWKAINGSVITSPELVYKGYVSRCSISVNNNELVILSGEYYQGSKCNYRVHTWHNNTWQTNLVALNEYGLGWCGYHSAWKIENKIHVFVSMVNETQFKPSKYVDENGDLIIAPNDNPFIVQPSKNVYMVANYPFTNWTLVYAFSEDYTSHRCLTAEHHEGTFLVLNENKNQSNIWKITRIP
ncbi:MAG: hypothetical protein QXJ02_05705 [Candidatus Bathyarchaeia archaeon]